MRRTLRRHRLLLAALSTALVGAVLAGDAAAATGRDAGDDPHAYVAPHAGLVAPPRAPGPLAPATGALIGTHSDSAATAPIDQAHQRILQTEASAGRVLDIDNSYYGSFSSNANAYDPTKPG